MNYERYLWDHPLVVGVIHRDPTRSDDAGYCFADFTVFKEFLYRVLNNAVVLLVLVFVYACEFLGWTSMFNEASDNNKFLEQPHFGFEKRFRQCTVFKALHLLAKRCIANPTTSSDDLAQCILSIFEHFDRDQLCPELKFAFFDPLV